MMDLKCGILRCQDGPATTSKGPSSSTIPKLTSPPGPNETKMAGSNYHQGSLYTCGRRMAQHQAQVLWASKSVVTIL